ncbi:SDR family NAD(P)-dependent oxidoreductase [Streptomyces yaizuensis]|uniref:Type I polyketide synthase n=1 Tax=Streptomyces yaizuensis TaxID=2989713 RepID=A0ABQ5NXP1_9ACTN|nr:SDR family NAD(P)-dependent oxidoreductase [Streptomyces sp. YSPA8]GLF95132.1 type I polyketide synthase [Streptomyces sp. YSPA8]
MAVVGVGCRLPGGVRDMDGLWRVLDTGRDVITEVPADRFDAASHRDPDPGRVGTTYTVAGGFLDGVDLFDAAYFGISPREASRMDPQQRLLLECAVDAFDDAQIDTAALAGSDTAVVMGVSARDYFELRQRRPREWNAYEMSGGATSNTANRLSYVLGTRGPSFAVDTACSSAMTAVHQACDILRTGRSALAVAGGVNVLINPAHFVGFSKASMLSLSGRCRPFSARADGFVRSEGAGVLVLKPLTRAIADGDRVHAVIVASAVNADGTTSGLALPSTDAQRELLERVYAEAGIAPHRVGYVEAHGTGTKAGDPVECRALGQALGTSRPSPLPVGSVKGNLGHLEAASGMAGLLKALLVLRHRTIPATAHALPLNDGIDFSALGIAPVTANRPLGLEPDGVIGVNGFGFGGANAHIVLAPAPDPQTVDRPPASGPVPLIVSGRTERAADAAAGRLADHLRSSRDAFHDIAYTSCRRRTVHEHRRVVLAEHAGSAAAALRALAEGERAHSAATGAAVGRGRVGFVFSGNGSVWPAMGRDLLDHDAAFSEEVSHLDAALRPHLGWSVLDALRDPPDGDRMRRTEVAQPLLFALQSGLVAALAAYGIRPAAVCGHSVGEVAAAHCAGALDREAACRVIAARSRAQAPTRGSGGMAAVGLGHERTRALLAGYGDRIVIAAVNSEVDTTVSGDIAALAALGSRLRAEDVFYRELPLDHAFHSPAMDPVRHTLLTSLPAVEPLPCRIPFVSSVTGRPVEGSGLDGEYWWRNVREPVRFADALDGVLALGCDVLVEIGPHPVLAPYLRRGAARGEGPVAVVPTLRRDEPGAPLLRTAVATAVAAGAGIDWDALFPHGGRTVALPAYPWQRERHWAGDPSWWRHSADDSPISDIHPLLGERLPTATPGWHQHLQPGRLAWLADHRVGGTVVLPAAAYVDMALAAGQQVLGTPVEISGLSIPRALTLPFDDPEMDVRLQSTLTDDGRFTVASRIGPSGPWREHATGRVRHLTADRPDALDTDTPAAAGARSCPADQHYSTCTGIGLAYGPAFRPLTALTTTDHQVIAHYTATVPIPPPWAAHTTLLDAALQAVLPLMPTEHGEPVLHLPSGIGTVRSWRPLPPSGRIHVTDRDTPEGRAVRDLTITDHHGEVALQATGLTLRRFNATHTTEIQVLTEVRRAAPLPDTTVRRSPIPTAGELRAATHGPLNDVTAHADDHRHFRTHAYRLTAHHTVRALRALIPHGTTVSVADAVQAGVDPRHTRWLSGLCRIAADQGLLERTHPGRWTLLAEPTPEQAFRQAVDQAPSVGPALHPLAVCGQQLPDLLRGHTDPLELLFAPPDHLAARLYDWVPGLRCQYSAARALLRASIARRPAGRPLRILEVGAGTGGLTAELLPELPPETTRFTLTDISAALFPHCQDRFADYDFIDFKTFDLDVAPADQGIPPGGFDLVLAANALHTAHDLAWSLRHVASLLTSDGALISLEMHNPDPTLMVFGMLDSFWNSRDTALRPHGPTLARDAWPGLLSRCGFTTTAQTGHPHDPRDNDFSTILAVRKPPPAPRPPATTAAPAPEPPRDRAPRTGRWVIAEADPSATTGHPLARQVHTSLQRQCAGGTRHVADPADPDAWTKAIGAQPGPVGLVLLTPDNQDPDQDPDPDQDRDQDPSAGPAAHTERAVTHLAALRSLATACDRTPAGVEATVWIVVPSGENHASARPAASAASALWGAGRTLANESPSVPVKRIVLTVGDDIATAAQTLISEFLSGSDEDEVRLTAEGRFVHRVTPLPPAEHPLSGSDGFTLDIPAFQPRYQVRWKRLPRTAPPPGQVRVTVEAAALNYRDALTATGDVPVPDITTTPGALPIGTDFAGTVEAVGPDVTGLTPGDRVMGVALGSLGSHALTPADLLIPTPEALRSTEAATMPTAFLTVQHALGHLARLTAGETLLLHSGAGGVGLAALQYARHIGATVIATAGSPARRELLRLLGADHVLDSRTLRFTHEARELTGGRGVDVVLNSLAGEALRRSVELLAPYGRFVELGKRDFLADRPLPLAPFLHNLTFFGVDLTPVLLGHAPVGDHLRTLETAIRTGTFRPLLHQIYPGRRIREAFHALEHSRHPGKIVIDLTEPVPVHQDTRPALCDPAAAYLITGGLSGIGAATARHLATRGARRLVLISRRGTRAPEANTLLAELRNLGVEASAHAVDVSDLPAMRALFDSLDAEKRRLAGIVHAAMILDDAPLTELTDDRLRSVLTPKVTGALVLDHLTRDRHPDFVLYYSSVATLLGNLRQSAYTAANKILEDLAQRQRDTGTPALAIQLGAVSDTGYAHRTGAGGIMSTHGFPGVPVAQVLREVDRILARPRHALRHATVTIGRMDWNAAAQRLPALAAPRTAPLLPPRDRETAPRFREHLANIAPEQATDTVENALREVLAQVLRTTPEHIHPTRALDQMGLDSLMTTELNGIIHRTFDCALPPAELTGAANVHTVGRAILTRLGQHHEG